MKLREEYIKSCKLIKRYKITFVITRAISLPPIKTSKLPSLSLPKTSILLRPI